MRESANIPYLTNLVDTEQINAFIHDKKPYQSGSAQQANEAFMRIKTELEGVLHRERESLIHQANHYIEQFQTNTDFKTYLSPDQKHQIQKPFLDIKQSVNSVLIIDTLKNNINAMPNRYTEQLDLAEELIYQAKIEKGEIEVAKPKPTVSISAIQRRFKGKILESEAEVSSFIDELRSELLETIKEDKKVSL